jgi:hypothetical protein
MQKNCRKKSHAWAPLSYQQKKCYRNRFRDRMLHFSHFHGFFYDTIFWIKHKDLEELSSLLSQIGRSVISAREQSVPRLLSNCLILCTVGGAMRNEVIYSFICGTVISDGVMTYSVIDTFFWEGGGQKNVSYEIMETFCGANNE